MTRKRLRVAPSRIERSPRAAGGRGFPAGLTVPVSCDDLTDRSPVNPGGKLDRSVEDAGDCDVTLTVRTLKKYRLGKGARRRLLLGKGGSSLVLGRKQVDKGVQVNFDGAKRRPSVNGAFALERLIRRARRMPAVVSVVTIGPDGRKRRTTRRVVLLAPRGYGHGCRTGCRRP